MRLLDQRTGWIVLACCSSTLAAGPVDLSLRPDPERETHYRVENIQSTRSFTPQFPNGVLHTSTISYTFAVKPKVVNQKGTVIELRLLTYAYKTEQDGKTTSFDSAKPDSSREQQAMAAHFSDVPRKTITITLSPTGDVSRVAGVGELPSNPLVENLARELFSKDGVQRKIGPIMTVRGAPSPAAVGAEWKSADKIPMGNAGNATAENTHRLESVADDIANITIDSPLTFPESLEHAGTKMIPTGGKITGAQAWSLSCGCLDRFDGTQDLTIEVETPEMKARRVVEVRSSIRRESAAPAGAPQPPAPASPSSKPARAQPSKPGDKR